MTEEELRKWWRPKYPHLSPQEVMLWHEFLRQTKLKFIKVDYDVHVGPGYVPSWLKDPKLRYMCKRLTQLRIDVVAETRDEIWIFEIKPRAGRSALGQLISYAYWYRHDFKPTKPIRLGVICRDVDYNLIPIFEQRGIAIFKV